jgi:hypothetical protein
VFYCEPETSGQGEELQVITNAEEVVQQLIEVMLITFSFFFLSLCPFFLTGCDPQGICDWRKSSERCILRTGTPKAVDRDFQRGAVCFLCMTVPVLILRRD